MPLEVVRTASAAPQSSPAREPGTAPTPLGAFARALKCRECGKEVAKAPVHVCEFCFGPLEVAYDYDGIGKVLTRAVIEARPQSMWRYAELLPLDGAATVGAQVGMTPLVRAHNLEKKLGLRELWIKNDAVSYPTLSFKDRVVSVAVSKAREFGMNVIACASTGNLANAVAAHAAQAHLTAYILIPHDLEQTKIMGTQIYGANVIGINGTYDDVNRLCSEVAGKYGWGFVNVNLRPFYAEGSKAYGYEIAEQLGWRLPDHVVAPMAGGSLITKIAKAFGELEKLGLVAGAGTRYHGAQAAGCAPIADAVRAGREVIKPVKVPSTIAKSLAIGNPADGYYAIKTITGSGGFAGAPDDAEIIAAMKLLAETEGIFTETAGGVTLGATLKLLDEGRISRDESIVVSITGNGLKTTEPLVGKLGTLPVIGARLADFDAFHTQKRSS
ncbi:MAG: threonine synthase [Deltaproteobacteria bacterium]|nr:threonine synthase [Deltaproteobacteria bacterium]